MKKEIITTGKNVAEALEKAVAELGAPSSEKVEYTIIDEGKKGIFGIGAVPAKISASYALDGEYAALELVKQLLADMGIDATFYMNDVNNDDKLIKIEGDAASVLIGHHGDTLDSLQYLANLAANRHDDGKKHEYIKITIDIGGYRAKRESALRALARKMAAKVLKYKKSVMLEPMSPYERRIIHSEVQNIKGVSTNSIGVDNNRKVVMYLDEKNETIFEDE